MAALILGVDGGGTKTVAVLADCHATELGRGVSGPSNFQAVGVAQAQAALSQAVRAAFDRAGLPPQPVSLVCLGIAGVGRDEDRAWLRAWCQVQELAEEIEIMTDAELLLWAGTPAGWGLGCVSGTGSIAFGADSGGKKARAGGWGYILGDEGSGYAIGLAALRAVTRAADGRAAPTSLTGRILSAWNLPDTAGLIPLVYHGDLAREKIGSLAGLVAEEAQAGDEVALGIFETAARDLAAALVSVARQLGFTGPTPCALGGGVLVHLPELVVRVVASCQAAGVVLHPVSIVTDPVQGALRLAARRLA